MIRRILTALLLATGLAVSGVALAPAALADQECPAADGDASWGAAKVCSVGRSVVGSSKRFHLRDTRTDGSCVRVYRWSADFGAWRPMGPSACTLGKWISFTWSPTTNGAICDHGGPRLYREGTANYFTLPKGPYVC